MSKNVTIETMIARRVSKGFNAEQSRALLIHLIASHDGCNLESALVYQEFATDRQAGIFAGTAA